MLVALLFGGASLVQAQTNIGVIDSDQILAVLPAAVQADKLINDQLQAARDTFNLLEKKYMTDLEAYQAKSKDMTPEEKAQEDAKFRDYQQRVRQWAANRENELKQKRTQMFAQIRETVVAAVNGVAAEMNLDAVVDKKAGGMIFVSSRIDITDKVKQRLGL